MAHDVFICHSAKDKTTADAVCAMLEANGVRCWIAPRDVTAGMEWSECIIDAIEECRVMVLVFTTNANESGQIRREIERAVNRGVAILPLRIEDILPARALEYFIGNVHWMDALTPPLESHLQNLAGTVKILLGRLPHHSSPIPHATPDPPVTFTPKPLEIPRPIQAAEKSEIEEPATQRPVAIPAPPSSPEAPAPLQTPTPPRVPIPSPPPPPSPSPETVDANKLKRPIGASLIALADFIFAGLMVIAFAASNEHDRNQFGIWLVLLGLFAAGVGFGILRLKNVARFLQILLAATGIVWLISAFQEAMRGASDFIGWLMLFALFGVIVWYMNTNSVRLAYGAPARGSAKIESAGTTAPAQQNPFAGLSAKGTGRRPGVVLFISILSFIEAGIWVLPIWDDFSHGRAKAEDFGAFLLVCAAAATGYGLLKLMGWARFLKVIVAAVDAVLMISVAQNAFHEGGGGEVAWICMFIFIVWSAWFMFAPRVKQAFSKAA